MMLLTNTPSYYEEKVSVVASRRMKKFKKQFITYLQKSKGRIRRNNKKEER